jgi:hypothetical protein
MARTAADSSVRLQWEVCKDGYEIRPDDWNEWRRDFDEDWKAREYIMARSNRFERYEVGLLESEISANLINSARQPGAAGVCEFVNVWGLLTPIDDEVPLQEFLDKRDYFIRVSRSGYKYIAKLLDEARNLEGLPHWALGALWVQFLVRRGKPQLYFRAQSLLQFCVLELVQAQAGGLEFSVCGACQKVLPLHREGRPRSFCDNACKMKAWRKGKARAVRRAAI